MHNHLKTIYTTIPVIAALFLISLPTGSIGQNIHSNKNKEVFFRHVIIDSLATRPAKPYGKAIGDLNGDGLNDVFISSANNGGMYWYKSPSWDKHPVRTTGSWSEDCLITDIDGDGDADIINSNNDGVFWYENKLSHAENPNAADWPAHKIGSDGTNIHDIGAADFNLDGKTDIVIRYEKEFGRPAKIFLQQDRFVWKDLNVNQSHLVGEGLAVGDVDDDGDSDLVLNEIWCENRGKGEKWIEHLYADSLPSQILICLADINSNGKIEIVVCPQSVETGSLAWYSNSGKNLWDAHPILSGINKMHGLTIADFNNDGFPDIHTSFRIDHTGSANNVSIWLNEGKPFPSFKENVLSTGSSHFSKTGDLDGDGDIDIVGANWKGNNPIEIWLNNLNP